MIRKTAWLVIVLFVFGSSLAAPSVPTLAERIQKIIDRPQFRHSSFGIEFYSLDTGNVVFELDGDKLFTPASTTKLLTEGTALVRLGADYRFHTRVYRTGPVLPDGTLDGDLVLVASGDPNLSGRIRADGTLAFENVDHAYAGSPDTRAVPGDPLLVIHELGKQVAAHQIKRIKGRVYVDVSLFPEGDRDLGTGIVISPVAVNDNIVDVTISPGAAEGAPVNFEVSPKTAYVRFINHATTGKPDSKPAIDFASDVANSDGSHTVTVAGTFPAGKPGILYAYPVPAPSRFAEFVLVEALQQVGVSASVSASGEKPDFQALSARYTPENVVAEHVSPPFKEECKVTLKVSQNLHASMAPFILGAVLAHKDKEIEQAGFDLEREFLEKAGLDLTGASQSDGAGGADAAFFTPDFMVHYLAYMAQREDYPAFLRALPILGHDGTLWDIQIKSPAAGHVFAKTGTFFAEDKLNRNLMLTGKGLAGYMTTADGRHLAFALYVNRVPVSPENLHDGVRAIGDTLGEIATAAYEAPAEPRSK